MSSKLKNSGIRVAVSDCSVTERLRWRPPYQTGKTVHVHAKHYKHKDGRMAPGVCGNGTAEPLGESRYENWNTHTHTLSYLLHLSLQVPVVHFSSSVLKFEMGQTEFI